MWVYFFDRHYGHDRVVQVDNTKSLSAWDFFEIRGIWYWFCLWENISRVEQYTKYHETIQESELIMIQKKLLDAKTLEILHRFTRYRFCTYKKAIPLWIQDPEQLAKRKLTFKKSKVLEQTLTIYPNLWTIMNDSSLDLNNMHLLHGQSTKKMKAEGFWWVKNGSIKHLICTYSQLFKQRENLTHITLKDQHAWWYKNQQDPRYHTVDVVKEMAKVYGAELELSGFSIES